MGIIHLAFPILMVLAPVVGYIPQYFDILRTGNPKGFSTLVSFILIVSNTIRLFYWFGARFELFLLFQAIVMIVAQLALLKLCVELRRRTGMSSSSNSLFDPSSFWNWPSFATYLQCIGLLCLIFGLLTWLFANSPIFVELTGVLALGIEATLALPQVYSNMKNRSTEGLNLILVATWFIGDAFKTFVFIHEASPTQFVACGSFQLFVDCVVLTQLAFYRN